MRGLGTLLNIAAVLVGAGAGVLIGDRLPERVRVTIMQGLGLLTMFLGFHEALLTRNALLMLGALLIGGIIGELLHVEDRLASIGTRIERRIGRRVDQDVPEHLEPADAASATAKPDRSRFVDGFLVASLVFCVGPLTILGSIQDGLSGDIDLLATKSALDGFAALAFATTLGWGVAASVVTIAVLQGGLTASAVLLDDVLTDRMIDETSAVGGLLLIGIGLRLLDIAEVRVASFLPALLVAPLLVAVFGR